MPSFHLNLCLSAPLDDNRLICRFECNVRSDWLPRKGDVINGCSIESVSHRVIDGVATTSVSASRPHSEFMTHLLKATPTIDKFVQDAAKLVNDGFFLESVHVLSDSLVRDFACEQAVADSIMSAAAGIT